MDNIMIWSTALTERKEVNANTFLCSNLPNELLLQILKYLGHSDLQQIRLVCRSWQVLTQFPEFMQKSKLIINSYNLPALHDSLQNDDECSRRLAYDSVELYDLEMSDDLKRVLKSLSSTIQKLYLCRSPIFAIINDCLSQLEELRVSDTPMVPIENVNSIDLNKFNRFKSLDINCRKVSNNVKFCMMLHLTKEVSPKLEKFCIQSGTEQHDLLIYFLQFHSKTLKHLELHFDDFATLAPEWIETFSMLRNLEIFKISGVFWIDWLINIMNILPKEAPLKYCDLGRSLTLELFELIINKWPNSLINMEMIHSNSLTDETVKELVSLRHNLSILNISNCYQISIGGLLQGIAMKTNNTLRTLVFNNDTACCNSLQMQTLIQRLPSLTYLNFEMSSACIDDTVLSHIFRHQIHLQHLNLNDCKQITDNGLLGFGSMPAPIENLKGLKSLSLRDCKNITDRALRKCFKFVELRKLNLGYCSRISSLGIKEMVKNCPALEDLNISSCFSIDDDSVLYIAQGLPRLRRLNINNCTKVTSKSLDYILQFCYSLKELLMCGIDSLDFHETHKKIIELRPDIFDYFSFTHPYE